MDKREAVRVPVRVRAQCRCSGIVIDGLVEDVSRSGLFLSAPKVIEPGTCAEIELVLPGEETLYLVVEVVRIERRVEGVGMGVKFTEQPERSRSLANFIMRQHQTSR